MANNTGKKYGGRQAGTSNKLTKELREALKNILHQEIDLLPDHLSKLEAKDRLDMVVKLFPFVLPKVEAVSHTENEPLDWGEIIQAPIEWTDQD